MKTDERIERCRNVARLWIGKTITEDNSDELAHLIYTAILSEFARQEKLEPAKQREMIQASEILP